MIAEDSRAGPPRIIRLRAWRRTKLALLGQDELDPSALAASLTAQLASRTLSGGLPEQDTERILMAAARVGQHVTMSPSTPACSPSTAASASISPASWPRRCGPTHWPASTTAARRCTRCCYCRLTRSRPHASTSTGIERKSSLPDLAVGGSQLPPARRRPLPRFVITEDLRTGTPQIIRDQEP